MVYYHSDNESDNIMNDRQVQLFKLVTEHYIATAEPVGSKFLVAEAGLEWSEATVRNDLRALEDEGLLTHPHTSAGRIPTTKGYRSYLNDIVWADQKLKKTGREKLEQVAISNHDLYKRQLAKTLVDLTSEMVLVTESLSSFYYTGLSSLFAQPEFKDVEEITNFSRLFDQFERCVALFTDQVGSDACCFVGGEHPFGERMGVIAIKFGVERDEILAVLGPERMDYVAYVPLVVRAAELLKH